MANDAERAFMEAPPTTKNDPFINDTNAMNAGKDGEGTNPGMKHYWRIFTYCESIDWVFMTLGALASLGGGVTMPLMNIVFGQVVGDFSVSEMDVNSVGEVDMDQMGELAKKLTDATNRNTLYIVYLFIAKLFLIYISMYCFRRVGTRLSAKMRLLYLRALFNQSVSQLDLLPSGEAANVITGGANTLQIGITDKVGMFLQFLALIIGSVAVAFKYSWQLTLVTSSALVASLLLFTGTSPLFLKKIAGVNYANGQCTSIASETITAIRMVIACGAESRMAKRHAKWVEEAKQRGLDQSWLYGVQLGPIFFIMFADYALCFWFGVKLYQQGHIANVGTVMIVLLSVMMSILSLGQLYHPFLAAQKAAGAAAQFFDKIDKPVDDRSGLSGKEICLDEDLKFEGVTFAYPTRPHVRVMDNFTATFPKGKLTAIVGPSGSGKSTVVGLIERWYGLTSEAMDEKANIEVVVDEKNVVKDAKAAEKAAKAAEKKVKKSKKDVNDEKAAVDANATMEVEKKENVILAGSIRIGHHDIKDVDMKWWRSQIGLVQQEPFLFNLTIFENVSYGLMGTEWADADETKKRDLVKDACKEAYADEFISRLPKGYDTLVGDSGMKLSGGQRQRLAIARAIIKRPQILIFDEATSAIDVRGERIVQAALDRASKHRTTITIAHRLSTIRRADQILVVAKGRLVESGTHDELVAVQDGVYHNLVNAQQLMMGEHKEWDIEEEHVDSASDQLDDMVKIEEKKEKEGQKWKRRGLIRSFGKLLLENKPTWTWMIATMLGSMGAGAAMAVMSFLLGNIVSIFGQYSRTSPELESKGSFWALAFVYSSLGVGICYFVMAYGSNELSIKISNTYRQQYFEGVVRKPIHFFDADENSAGSLVARLSSDPVQLQELLGTNMGFFYIAIFSMFANILLSLIIGWKLALVALSAALPLVFTAGYYRVRFELKFEKMNAAVFAESSQFASEAFGAVRTVTSLTLEDMICARYSKLLDQHVRRSERKSRWTAFVFAISDSVGMLCMALAFWYGGKLISSGEYDLKNWLIIYNAIIQGSEAAGNWMSFGPNMAQASGAANRILSLRETGPPATGREVEAQGGVDIEFKNVGFNYASRSTPIFSDLNIHIKRGQFAALVGPSGCGKSTIISLLEQFYQVNSGELLIDGQNAYELDLHSYRRLFSLVAQEATLFQGTLRENILLGIDVDTAPLEMSGDANIEAVCREAEIWDFICSLPDGLSTDVGSKGVALSGGQKQRISIARALIREPQCLLLDEATSSLDSESEKLIQGAFEKAGEGRTMVVVAHRLATIQNADVIFVLGGQGERGARVLEQGSHQKLIAKRGVYYQMCQSQALDR